MEDLGSIVLSEDDVPGAKFKSTPETYNMEQLKRWLKCHGMKVGGRKPELVERVRQCIAMKIGVGNTWIDGTFFLWYMGISDVHYCVTEFL